MDVDEALGKLGQWGKWQVSFYLMLCVANTFPASWHMLAIVFLGAIPDHTCTIPDGKTLNKSIPIAADGKGWDKCSKFEDITVSNRTVGCDGDWTYTGDVGKSIVNEWDLVCDRSALVEMSQTIMVLGVMFGAMFFSMMSDRFGRKPVFLFSEIAMVVVGVTTSFVNNYYLFCVLRFCAGALQQGIILTGFVMACELFPAENRTFAGMALEDFWATGMCLLAGFAYVIRDWHYLQLLISLPGILCIALIWVLPESVPWLAANDRLDQAEEIIHRAARFNGVTLPKHVLMTEEQAALMKDHRAREEEEKLKLGRIARFMWRFKRSTSPTPETKEGEDAPEETVRYTLLDVVKHPLLRRYSIIMCCLWFVNSLVYYGLSLSTASLAGNRYMNFFLSGLVEIPAYTSCIFILQKWGRRWPLAIFHIIAGVALCITMVIPKETSGGTSLQWLIIMFNMIGKFGITGSFGTVFLYAPEIFPTTLRNQAMGISSLGGRLGNMLAPFASLVARVVPWLPGILFGGLSVAVGLLTLALPETLNKPLPQTIEDIENWSKPQTKDINQNEDQHQMEDIGNNSKA